MNRLVLLSLFTCCAANSFNIKHDFRGFDDSILFSVKWPGFQSEIGGLGDGIIEEKPEQVKVQEVLNVKTTNNELYQCNIPELIINETPNIEDYNGPSPLATLRPLFSQKICSYRLESYWTYEVCHGRFVRQYHEERDGKQVKNQQYYLGIMSSEKQKKLEKDMLDVNYEKKKPKYTKIDGVAMPYVEVILSDGTLCELVGKPRMIRVLYVCYGHSKHEVYSFKETSTCEYEIVVLSPLLCNHPQFMPKTTTENIIECIPTGATIKAKPKNMMLLETDLLNQSAAEAKQGEVLAVVKIEKIDKDGETHLKIELKSLEDQSSDSLVKSPGRSLDKPATPVIADDSPVRAFLNGDECLVGGSGWWKYEFCYGKHVSQYHEDRIGTRTLVRLGTFDLDTHLQWMKENSAKAPAPLDKRTSISHFYSNGDFCEKTGRPRQTEVKLKCVSTKSSQVTIYLLEPKTCNYILGVESPLICDILPLADENGLVQHPILAKKKTQSDNKEYQKRIADFIKEIQN